jgi:hypothetical protein
MSDIEDTKLDIIRSIYKAISKLRIRTDQEDFYERYCEMEYSVDILQGRIDSLLEECRHDISFNNEDRKFLVSELITHDLRKLIKCRATVTTSITPTYTLYHIKTSYGFGETFTRSFLERKTDTCYTYLFVGNHNSVTNHQQYFDADTNLTLEDNIRIWLDSNPDLNISVDMSYKAMILKCCQGTHLWNQHFFDTWNDSN